ncbi:DUF6686 family protein [Sediminibacterium ginsengisoli]|uniref:Uncharacterized protein n=1 Tax=Sediminibacterium ginsengisoli TaxID=413434 RepID=A0A1T4K5F3_9BACT|nr:DUF6686 family protein [Sediminibacterium ginsengisoli]SJZ37664.1 hypothetical protein SAMN04488132_101458 [Sediminibacterium ginsengisoli]
MCRYHTCFHNDAYGVVVVCLCCQTVQVSFGMLLLTFSERDFQNFRSYVQMKAGHYHPAENKCEKNIIISTPCDGLNLLFSYNELLDLNYMLDESDTEIKTFRMLQLFKTDGAGKEKE